MTVDTRGRRSPEAVDRLMVGACGAIWLVLLVVAVVASVALVNLGSAGHGGTQSPWVLYTVVVVSALTILGAIPLLLRARRDALAGQPPAAGTEDPAPPASPAGGGQRVFGVAVNPYRGPSERAAASPVAAALHRVWLRGSVSLLGAMGLALTAVAAGTYLLAAGSDTAAVIALGTAGAVVLGLPAVMVHYRRRLDSIARP